MKHYIDALNDAGNARERRQVTRDMLGTQEFNVGAFIGGWIAGSLIGGAIDDMLGGSSRRSYRDYDDYEDYDY